MDALNDTIGALSCFNSMIVRLKDIQLAGRRHYAVFQFYDSPIKSLMTLYSRYIACRFQFYDSPIKRQLEAVRCCLKKMFQFYDSPIKSYCKRDGQYIDSKFQFYDSPIKRPVYSNICPCRVDEFQFYDSPIKSKFHGIIPLLLVARFNSMIVRLKVLFIFLPPSFTIRFQFYDSPIKSMNRPSGSSIY